MVEFVQDLHSKVGFEPLLVRAGDEILLGSVAEVGLEYAGGTHGQEVFVDDRVELDEAFGDQCLKVGVAYRPRCLALCCQRVGEIAEALGADGRPIVGEFGKARASAAS